MKHGLATARLATFLDRAFSRGYLQAAILLAPGLALLAAFFFAPLGILARYSFNRFIPGGSQEEAFIAENYIRFLTDDYYARVMLRTFALGVAVAVATLILAYPLAYSIARSRTRWKGVVLTIVLIPLMTSVVVRTYGWTILLANGGVINSVLEALGLPRVKLLFTMTGVVMSLTQVLMPFMVLTLMGVLQNISPDLEEAARSLGASRWSVFWTVLLPLGIPGVAAGSFLVFALAISAFATPRLVGGASIEVMATMVYDQVLNSLNWPFASATSLIMLAVVLGLTMAQARLLRSQASA